MDEQREKLLKGGDIAKSEGVDVSGEGSDIDGRARARTNSICSSTKTAPQTDWARHAMENFESPIKLSFKNLQYSVRLPTTKAERKQRPEKVKDFEILKECTGVCLPGQTTYIMGASGAGKTSLLNVLSDRIAKKKGTKLEGEILLNDKYPLD